MFEVLVYLFHNYYTPEACPSAEVLARRLAAAGFEHEDIDDALGWLHGLAQTSEDFSALPNAGHKDAVRVYADAEWQQLGHQAIGLVMFLEDSGVLVPPLREIVIERAMACAESPVSLETMKIISLMVLWSQEAEIDGLVMEELLRGDDERLTH